MSTSCNFMLTQSKDSKPTPFKLEKKNIRSNTLQYEKINKN